MAKPTKSQRRALAAMDDAARAATRGTRLARKLPKRAAKKIRVLVSEAQDASDVSKKALRRRPKRVAKRARKAATRLLVATDKVEKEAARRVDEERMAKDAQRLKAEFADPADFVKLNKTASRSAAADLEPVLSPDAILDPPEEGEPAQELSALTVAQLRLRASEAGKTGYWRLTKAQLIDLLS